MLSQVRFRLREGMVAIVIVAAFVALVRDIAQRSVKDPSGPSTPPPYVHVPSGKVILSVNPRLNLRRFKPGDDIPLDWGFVNDTAEPVTIWSARAELEPRCPRRTRGRTALGRGRTAEAGRLPEPRQGF